MEEAKAWIRLYYFVWTCSSFLEFVLIRELQATETYLIFILTILVQGINKLYNK
jgi:hypothetical protein